MMTRRSLFLKAAATGAALTLAGASGAARPEAQRRKGTFEGRSNHITTGSVKLVKDGDRYIVELGEDFSLDNGPDPRVAFGMDGTYAPELETGRVAAPDRQADPMPFRRPWMCRAITRFTSGARLPVCRWALRRFRNPTTTCAQRPGKFRPLTRR